MGEPMGTELRIAVQGPNPPLALEFHPRGRAVYVRLSGEQPSRSVEVDTGAVADYDADGTLVGIELIGLETETFIDVLARVKQRFAASSPQLRALQAVTV